MEDEDPFPTWARPRWVRILIIIGALAAAFLMMRYYVPRGLR